MVSSQTLPLKPAMVSIRPGPGQIDETAVGDQRSRRQAAGHAAELRHGLRVVEDHLLAVEIGDRVGGVVAHHEVAVDTAIGLHAHMLGGIELDARAHRLRIRIVQVVAGDDAGAAAGLGGADHQQGDERQNE